jgi:putative DNA methylase
MLTFRLADALPADVVAELTRRFPDPSNLKHRQILQDYLDDGHGACHLRDPQIARMVEDAVLHFDGSRYHLLAWVTMPNHAHALIETMARNTLAAIVHSWKSYSALQANRLLGRTGAFWQRDYFDRVIRHERHLHAAIAYIESNPVQAGLVATAPEWPYGSARRAGSAGILPVPRGSDGA